MNHSINLEENVDGETALDLAIKLGHGKIVKLFLDNDAADADYVCCALVKMCRSANNINKVQQILRYLVVDLPVLFVVCLIIGCCRDFVYTDMC